ncbi:nitroreductase family protein [Sphingomonas sp. RS6]
MSTASFLPWRPYPDLSEGERLARAEDFRDDMSSRRSCRAFSTRAVPRRVIEAAIATAGGAPSGANRQPWHFCAIASAGAKVALRVAIEEEERRLYGDAGSAEWLGTVREYSGGADKAYLESAPWIIVAFGRIRESADELIPNVHVNESVGIACGLLLASLHRAGLATLVHTPDPAGFLTRICRRPAWEKPVMLIVAGHAADDATVPAAALDKKPLEQIASWL